ncbi:hypothetical protein ABFX02_10G086200 [Erythranthe guttata]
MSTLMLLLDMFFSGRGVLGIEAKVMLDWDPRGKQGLTTPLPEVVNIHPPKEEEIYIRPSTATTVPAEIDVQA